MKKIGSRLYYLSTTGEILVKTNELCGEGVSRDKVSDMAIYPELINKTNDEVRFIDLDYGLLETIFNSNLKSYSVNLETKTLDCVNYTQEDLDVIQKQNQEVRESSDRTSSILEYIKVQDYNTITDIEDYILQKEQNKITGGM